MEITDNLFNSTQKFLTSEYVNKLSITLNLPTEMIETALRSIIPSFLIGLVKKGSSEVGAQSLMNLARNQDVDIESMPNNLNNSSYLTTGHNTLHKIFGKELSQTVQSISEKTNLNENKVTTIMSMIAPIVMCVLKNKVQNEGLSAYGVVKFLKEQRPVLTDYSTRLIYPKITNYKREVLAINNKIINERSKTSFALTFTVAIVFGSFFLWWNEIDNKGAGSVVQMQEAIEDSSNESTELLSLKKFLDEGEISELPKSFIFPNFNFALGTTQLKSGALAEIVKVAEVLRDNPRVKMRIEGFTDNTGTPLFNIKLSEDRANTIKEKLVERGVHAERLEVLGLGQERSISSNKTEVGRAQNRRIELVILNI